MNKTNKKLIKENPWIFPIDEDKAIKAQFEALKGSIQDWTRVRPVVVIPLERAISYADQVIARIASLGQLGANFFWFPYARIDIVRNTACAHLLKSDYTHIIMLDVDHEHPVGNDNIIRRLARWAILRPDAQVVGALNFSRGEPFKPCVWLETDEKDMVAVPKSWSNGLMEVKMIGSSAIMIAREVFETLPLPWFYNIYDFAYENNYPGEDLGFSVNCIKNGIKMYTDTTTTCPHLTPSVVDEVVYKNYIKTHKLDARDLYFDLEKLLDTKS